MSWFQGFLVPVARDNRAAYAAFAQATAPICIDHGATRVVECWGDDLKHGQRTDMFRAVGAADDETVVFSWIEWPDRATCEAARAKIVADPRMQTPPDPMPFDGRRMIYADFETVHETGPGGPIGYVDGLVARVPGADRAALAAFDDATSALFQAQGATRLVSGWSTEIAPGGTTDFLRAVEAEPGAAITFGWMEWPDKATRDAGMAAMMSDPRMAALQPAWDGPTAIFGGFSPIFDTRHAQENTDGR